MHRGVGEILELSEADIDLLTKRLTTQYYTHQHQINRREARSIGLPVVEPSDEIETLLWSYYKELCLDLELLQKFDPTSLVQTSPAATPTQVKATRATVETIQTCDIYVTEGTIISQNVQTPGGMQHAIAFQIIREDWEHLT